MFVSGGLSGDISNESAPELRDACVTTAATAYANGGPAAKEASAYQATWQVWIGDCENGRLLGREPEGTVTLGAGRER